MTKEIQPAKNKRFGCKHCKFYQYSPNFDPNGYKISLDPQREDRAICSYMMEARGASNPRVLVVLESPTRHEDDEGNAFSSASARIIRRNLTESGVDIDEVAFTYAVKCHCPDKPPTVQQAVYCSDFLADDIRRLKPDFIMAFGSTVLRLLLGKPQASILQFHSVPQQAVVAGHSCVVYPMWSTGYVMRNDYLNASYMDAFDKFARLVRGDEEPEEDTSLYRVITTPAKCISLIKKLVKKADEQELILDWDLETDGLNPYLPTSTITTFSFALNEKRGYACVLWGHADRADKWTDREKRLWLKYIEKLLTHRNICSRLHNSKFDYKYVKVVWGFWPRIVFEDSMLTHYASDENVEHGLKPLAIRYTDMGDYDAELDRYEKSKGKNMDWTAIPVDLLGKYAAMDAVAINKLSRTLRGHLEEQDDWVRSLAYDVMPRFSDALTRVEAAGVMIDVEFGEKIGLPWVRTMAKQSYDAILSNPTVRMFIRNKTQEAEESKPRKRFKFSLGSSNQLRELFFDEQYLGYTPSKLTPSGAPSTDKQVLAELDEQGCPLAKRIKEFRLDEKLDNTYMSPIIERVRAQVHRLLHCSFLLHGTVTGRLASRDPNLQNIPGKGAAIVKRMFITRYGDRKGALIQADYSQVELRVLAAISGDKGMIKAYVDGEDLHTQTACMVFDLTLEQYEELDQKEQNRIRTVAKRINFGIAYGIGGDGISNLLESEGIHESPETCKGWIEKFLKKRKAVDKWIQRVEHATEEDAISASMFGRRRRLEQVYSQVDDTVARALRQAVNHPIQSTASDITLTALTLISEEIQRRCWQDHAEVVLTVHDSIFVDAKVEYVDRVCKMMHEIMVTIPDRAHEIWGEAITARLKPLKKLPIEADFEVGVNWRDQVSYTPGETNIHEALFISRCKRKRFDKNPKATWAKKDDEKAKVVFAKRRKCA